MSKYTEPVVVVKERELKQLMGAFRCIRDIGGYTVVKCGKCGTLHTRDTICLECGNDPDDSKYHCKPVDLSLEVLDRF